MITGVIRSTLGAFFPPYLGDSVTATVTEEFMIHLPGIYTINPNDTLPKTFSVVGGDDQNFFGFSDRGLFWTQTPDADNPADVNHDNVYEVLIQVATDEGFDQLPVYITVVDDDSALAFVSPETASVRNHVSISTSVYQAALAEPEEITQITFSIISGEDQNLFHIDPETGVVTFQTAPDHFDPKDVNADNQYKITVDAAYAISDQEIHHVSQDVTIIVEAPNPGNDFNHDWASDILLQDAATGDCFVWQLWGHSGVSKYGSVGWTPPDAGWRAAATGDFNGDGISDILLQDGTTGDCYIWQQDGKLGTSGYGFVGWRPPTTDWEVKAAGDFNGDGISDILLQNSQTTQCYIWELKGTWGEDGRMELADWGAVGWPPLQDEQNDWRVKGAGDFNGDGISDILLQNAINGDCFIWQQDGHLGTPQYGSVGWRPPTADWEVKATGDFDGNGISDILLQNAQTTQCYIWELDGTWGEDGHMELADWGYIGWTPPQDAQNDWRVKSAGDYNHDGYSGILFQNAVNGQCYIWEQDGTTDNGAFTKLYASTVGWTPPTADWHAVA